MLPISRREQVAIYAACCSFPRAVRPVFVRALDLWNARSPMAETYGPERVVGSLVLWSRSRCKLIFEDIESTTEARAAVAMRG